MKNKMMKTVGIALVSTTILLTNNVVANENTIDYSCDLYNTITNSIVANITDSPLENVFNNKDCLATIIETQTNDLESTSITAEVTSFNNSNLILNVATLKIRQIIEKPIILSLYDPEHKIGSIILIDSKENTSYETFGTARMNLEIISPSYFNNKDVNLIKNILGFNPADRFNTAYSFNEISERGLNTLAGIVTHKLDNNSAIQISDTFSYKDIEYGFISRQNAMEREERVSSFEKMMKKEGYEVFAKYPSSENVTIFEKDGKRMAVYYQDI